MSYRMLLCLSVFALVTTAQSAESPYERPGENWNWGYGVEEGGGGSSYLGVDIADVTSERLAALKLKEEHGAEVTMVDQDAPAGKAGLKQHDVIVSLNGTAVESAAQLRRMIRETPAGRVVSLGISREGQSQTLKVQLANRVNAFSPRSIPNLKVEVPEIPVIADLPDVPISVVIAHSSVRSGLLVENITPQLGEFFGVKEGKGVLIRSVEKGSRSEKAGFRAGDVIVKVNSQPVRDTSDFTRAIRSTSGDTASVTVIRDKREQNLNLTLPSRKDSGVLLEESFDFPELTAQAAMQWTRAGEEMARMAPALEKLQQNTADCWKKTQEKVQESQKKFEEAQRKMEKSRQDMRQKLHDRSEKFRHEFSGKWLEI